jgi:hypothetical protein
MPSLFEPTTAASIANRINTLTPASQALWGKMNVAQMLAHCEIGLQTATGEKKLPRIFIGRLLSPFFKSFFFNEKPFSKNSPTDKAFVFTDERDFEAEKKKLLLTLDRFVKGGEANCTSHPHSFFGKLTPAQWGIGLYKHLDHHLRQFGA